MAEDVMVAAPIPLVKAPPRPIIIGMAIMIGMMVNLPSLVGSTFSLFLKPVSDGFGWGREEMSLAVFVAFLVTTPLYPIVGRLADWLGPRLIVLVGMLLFGISTMAMSLADGRPEQFLMLFLITSIAGTLVSGVVFGRGVAATFSSGRGKALGICLGLGGGLGAAMAPIFAAGLIGQFGWRGAYVGLGVLPIVIGFPILLLIFRVGRPAPEAQAAQSHAPLPLLTALRQPALWKICAIIFFACLANNGVLVHLAALLTDKATTPTFATLLVSSVAIATCFGQISAGFLLDRFGTPRVGLLFAGAMLLGLLLLQYGSTPAFSAAGIMLFGLGIGSEYSLIPYYISRYFGVGSFGQLYGVIYASASIAGGFGPYLMGMTFDRFGGYGIALSIFEAGLLIAIGSILLLPAYGNEKSPLPQ